MEFGKLMTHHLSLPVVSKITLGADDKEINRCNAAIFCFIEAYTASTEWYDLFDSKGAMTQCTCGNVKRDHAIFDALSVSKHRFFSPLLPLYIGICSGEFLFCRMFTFCVF
jgi:hypothetical protein